MNNGSALQVIFTPFLVDLVDLESGGANDRFQLLPSILLANPDATLVSNLEILYKKYYPRLAKERPLSITRLMTITWDLTTASSGNDSVSTVHELCQ